MLPENIENRRFSVFRRYKKGTSGSNGLKCLNYIITCLRPFKLYKLTGPIKPYNNCYYNLMVLKRNISGEFTTLPILLKICLP